DEVEQLLARFRAATRSDPDDPTRRAIFRAVQRRSRPSVATWTIAIAIAAALVLLWALADGTTATNTSRDARRDQALDGTQAQETGGAATTRAPARPVAQVPAPVVVPEPPASVAAPAPRAVVPTRPSAAQPSTPRDDDALARESALIRSARAAMSSGDRAAARAALDRHAREFASGMLARERWVLDIELACAANDHAGARRKAAAFYAAYPAAKDAKALRDTPCNAVTNPTTSGQLGE
ncbi:MAG TPA: hypothetical protein VG755_25720, partial [Nannocystaceae bacterium]|nr:hypothetical protein [Nannocystaceae bacterium]